MAAIFVTGATGYMGRGLCRELAALGHGVRGLARPGSERLLPAGCEPVTGSALDASSYRDAVRGYDTLVHLVGVPHPSPAKAALFRSIDLVSVHEAVAAALHAGVRHFVYVGVAHPAPVMQAYIAARREGEAMIRATGIPATVLRPWYVLGPGHRWPYALLPVYRLLEAIPRTREVARRLGLVTLPEMVRALVAAVEDPARDIRDVRVMGVSEIRNSTALFGARSYDQSAAAACERRN
jgi:uncharacterized protein YbjT (DUF2867 family)